LRRHAEACERVTRYIDRHYTDGLTAQQLARVGLLSEFHLQRSFAALTGYGMAGQIRRRRIEKAMHLLVSRTALGLDDVARQCGLSCASALIHLFRRELGLTPREFRQRAETLQTLSWGPAAPAGAGGGWAELEHARLVTLEPRELYTMTSFGSLSRHFAQVGFDVAERFERALAALPGHNPAWPMLSLYPERALGPADPTQRLVLATEVNSADPRTEAQLRLQGLRRATLAGGSYVVLDYAGAHHHTWMAWSRIRHGGLLTRLGLEPRSHAPVFEYVNGVTGQDAARDRVGVTLWLPVHGPRATATERAARDEEDQFLLAQLLGRPLNLAERLTLQRA
jgi:AraC-like DNA-binding protein